MQVVHNSTYKNNNIKLCFESIKQIRMYAKMIKSQGDFKLIISRSVFVAPYVLRKRKLLQNVIS